MNTTDAEQFLDLTIRYEGGDADRCEIDLNQLGESLQGFARIIAVSAHFVQTGKINTHFDALSVKVLAKPVDEHHCYEMLTTVKNLILTKEFFAGLGSGLLPAIVQFVLSRKDKQEMKHLSEALKRQMELTADQNNRSTDRLLNLVEKLADALKPAAKKATAPIGRSADHIDLYVGGKRFHQVDGGIKDSISNGAPIFSDHARAYKGVISELDKHTGACKMTIDGYDERISGQILDPAHRTPNNAYSEAMSSDAPIEVLAKAELDADGNIVKLFILDTFGELI